MFLSEIFHLNIRADYCDIPDPLDEPDDTKNPPNLEKYELAHRYGFDVITAEETYWGFRLWRRYGPTWMKFPLNPTDKKEWSIIRKVRDWVDRRDHYNRHVKELEIALAEGHSRIIIQPKHISEYASYFCRLNEYSHYYALNYGIACLWFTWRHPKKWWIYLPLLYISMCNAYVHSRFCRTDRFNPYRMIELDEVYDEVEFEPEVEDVGEIDQPEDFPRAYWVLKREGRVRSTILYLRNQCAACFAAFAVSIRMAQFEEEIAGPTHRVMNIKSPAINTCDYFLPAFLEFDYYWPKFIPKDIPKIFIYNGIAFSVDELFFLGLSSFYVWDMVTSLLPQNRPSTRATGKNRLSSLPKV